jgi:hypothetical protein
MRGTANQESQRLAHNTEISTEIDAVGGEQQEYDGTQQPWRVMPGMLPAIPLLVTRPMRARPPGWRLSTES